MNTLEKVARAISREAGGSPDDEAEWRVWLPEARAALMAIREPSADILEAGDSADYWCTEGQGLSQLIFSGENGESVPNSGLAIVWRTMIDAILNEKPKA